MTGTPPVRTLVLDVLGVAAPSHGRIASGDDQHTGNLLAADVSVVPVRPGPAPARMTRRQSDRGVAATDG
jgi:hypothetical protein